MSAPARPAAVQAEPVQAEPRRAVPPGDGQPFAGLLTAMNMPGSAAILLNGSRDPNSGLTVLLIPPDAGEPRLAVKIATTPAAAAVIEGEARLLTGLERLRLPRVGGTLPRHQGAYDVDGLLAVASTVVPGVPMSTGYHSFRQTARPGRVRADFAAAAGWLAGLHADSMAARAPLCLLDGAGERILARWPDLECARTLAGQAGAVGDRLARASTPRTIVHGDFWAGNLLVSDGAVSGVVDWAAGELSGEPLRDVARFALSYSLYLDRHTRPGRPVAGHPRLRADGWGAGIRYAIAGEHWYGRVVRDFVAGALTRLGAPASLWRDVLLAGIAEVAVTADHPEFAAHHRDLLLRLTGEVRP